MDVYDIRCMMNENIAVEIVLVKLISISQGSIVKNINVISSTYFTISIITMNLFVFYFINLYLEAYFRLK